MFYSKFLLGNEWSYKRCECVLKFYFQIISGESKAHY